MDFNDYLNDLLGNNPVLKEDSSKIDFENILDYSNSLDRQLYIGDITEGVGIAVDTVIRFWNRYDEDHNIPITDRKPIRIYIDSPGGSLTDTLTVIDAIKLSKTPVYTICVGCAYSGGFFIFISGHKRYCYPNSTFLYHEGSTANGGDAGKFRNFAEFYDKQLEVLKQITVSNTNIDEELYEKHRRDDWWMLASEALDLGVCDEILKELI